MRRHEMVGAVENPPCAPSADSTAARMLTTAAALFRSKGYASTTMRELAGLLGIRNASLYHHIGKKEDLLYALCIEALDNIRQAIEQVNREASTPADRLRALVRAHIKTILAERDKVTTMLVESRELSDGRRAEVLRLRDANYALVRQIIADAQAAGAVRSNLPAKHLALALLNLVNWTIFWFNPEGELTSDQLGDFLGRVLLEGIAVPESSSQPGTAEAT